MQQKTEQFSRQLAHILMPFISILHSAEKKMKMLRERTAVSLKNELLENFFTETLGASKKKKKKNTIDECSVGHPSIPFSLTASPGLWRGHTLAESRGQHTHTWAAPR